MRKLLDKIFDKNSMESQIDLKESCKYRAIFLCNISKKTAVQILLDQIESANMNILGEKHTIYPGGCLSVPVEFEGGVAKMIVKSNNSIIWNGVIPIGCDTEINISPETREIRYREQTLPQTKKEEFVFLKARSSYWLYVFGILLALMIYKLKYSK